MKKILGLSIVLLLAATAASAQPEKGSLFLIPQAGINVSTLKGHASIRADYSLFDGGIGTTATSLSRPHIGANLGLSMEYQHRQHWALAFGIEGSRQGTRFKDTEFSNNNLSNGHVDLDYIGIPLLMRYYASNQFAFAFGLQPRFLIHQQSKGDFSESASVANYTISSTAEDFSLVDATIPLSVSYYWASHTFCELRYNFGINLFNSDWIPYLPFCHNHCVSLTIGHKIKL
ncbi:MAG: PorT family protein [Bacteroidaceae bacterium]|nr:PorT family protein [Bacteroidaceae bacterium]